MNIYVDLDDTLGRFLEHLYDFYGVDYDPTAEYTQTWETNLLPVQEALNASKRQLLENLPRSFWASIPLTPWADGLVSIVRRYDPNFHILTTAVHTSACYAGKRDWVDTYFGHTFSRVILATEKTRLAGDRCVLIDDKPENISDWTLCRDKLGTTLGIASPQPWSLNREDRFLEVVEEALFGFSENSPSNHGFRSTI